MNQCPKSTLTDVYRREVLSLLQYVRQAPPYAGAADRPVLARLRELADTEADAVERFASFLERARIARPAAGAFPTEFTNYNFISVKSILPRLVADHGRRLAGLEKDLAALPPGEARTEVEQLTALKRMHLTELEKLAA
jgi:hypothetical protein